MFKNKSLFFSVSACLILSLFLITGCGSSGSSGNGGEERPDFSMVDSAIQVDPVTLPTGVPAWVGTHNFVPPADAGAAVYAAAEELIAGKISFTTTLMTTDPDLSEVWYRYPWAGYSGYGVEVQADQDPPGAIPWNELDSMLFPGLEVEFVATQYGDLIPVQRGIIRKPVAERTRSFWEIIIEPGKVWASTDEGYEGWTKASFPFALVQSQEGETLIGLACFYYKGNEVSDMYIQTSCVTAGGFMFWAEGEQVETWAQVPIAYTPGTVADPDAVAAAFDQELENRIPIRPLTKISAFDDVTSAAPENDLTIAFLTNGTLYVRPIDTIFGEYPYQYGMRAGVWSTTKSLFAGFAGLRLGKKYGTDFLSTKLVDYFVKDVEFTYPSAEAADRWKMVTLEHCLTLETGMGPTGSGPNWDGSVPNTYSWSYSYETDTQIEYYFNQEPNPDVSGPGEKLAYIDQDIWAAGLGMDRYLKTQEGSDATLLDMLAEEVYAPIGVDYPVFGSNYSDPPIALAAWGALPTIEHMAKAGKLIADHGMAPDGTQIFDSEITANLFENEDYEYAFWKETYTSPDGTEYIIPATHGAGGNYILCFPNGDVGVILGKHDYNGRWTGDERNSFTAAADSVNPFGD
ncbi:MAG: hypothetical protein GY850_04210 [bacterium]|nr:hypothetical protein [bacterium]